ncbi:alanine racemase [Tepidimicrobium xylanilyticum]|uniref:Alanine racemase n=1 Tax=Tepidimicrobium xylanilyticum TaxID=1123352 RepID=A0A1H2V3N4_9FIRM|nr:alanine racemase [Tepidimicrobium xylanilyticum]SDW62918.1 alanine racemase [Tepidimicrobium xylanilyticum]
MDILKDLRPVWAEVNLDNLAHNMREVKKNVNKGVSIMAVVKANAYGHGAIKSAETFLDNGAERLAVATLSEALELRKANIDVPILILGYTPKSQYSKVLKYDITQTIWDYESAKVISDAAAQFNKKAIVHLKVDSGMGRVGLLCRDETIEAIIKISKLPNLEIEGIYTHFATADEKDKAFTKVQYERFMEIIEALEKKGLFIPIKHVSNSAAIIDLPEYNLNMVRAGIMLYGFYPSNEVCKDKVHLKPAMNLKARISHVKRVPKGTGISYGQIFVTERESKIATIPIGYADGFTRLLTSKTEVFLKGKRIPVVGRICMDQCMLDVTDLDNVKVGDEVILFGYGKEGVPHVDEVANRLNTINYEIVCMVGRRVPRIYVKNGEIIDVIDYLLE